MEKKAEVSNKMHGTWSCLPTEQQLQPTAPASARTIYRERTSMQNHHDAKVEGCESPTPLTWKEDGNVTSTWYKGKEITPPCDVTHYELTEVYEFAAPCREAGPAAQQCPSPGHDYELVAVQQHLVRSKYPLHWLSDIATHTPAVKLKITSAWRTCAVLSYRTEKKPCLRSSRFFYFRKGTSKPKGTFSYLLHRKLLNEHPLAGGQTLLWWQGQQKCQWAVAGLCCLGARGTHLNPCPR